MDCFNNLCIEYIDFFVHLIVHWSSHTHRNSIRFYLFQSVEQKRKSSDYCQDIPPLIQYNQLDFCGDDSKIMKHWRAWFIALLQFQTIILHSLWLLHHKEMIGQELLQTFKKLCNSIQTLLEISLTWAYTVIIVHISVI